MKNLPTPKIENRKRCVGCGRPLMVVLDYPPEFDEGFNFMKRKTKRCYWMALWR